jgi:hypothetical protein
MELGRGNRSESRGATGLRRTCRALSVGFSLEQTELTRSSDPRAGNTSAAGTESRSSARRDPANENLGKQVESTHGTISPAILSALFPTEVPPNF